MKIVLKFSSRLPAFRFFGLVAALSLSCSVNAAFTNFITRSGSTIKDGAATFNFVSMNTPEVTHIRTDFNLREAWRFRLPTCAEIDFLVTSASQSHTKVIRTWCFPAISDNTQIPQAFSYFYKNADGLTVTLNEEAYGLFDYLIWVASAKNVRLWVPFIFHDPWGNGSGGCHPQFKDWITKVLNRVNPLTGTAYKNEKAIYAWATGNELQSAPDSWVQDCAAHIKSIDSNHLVIDGKDLVADIYDAYYVRTVLRADPNIDIVEQHQHGRAGPWPDNEVTWVALKNHLNSWNKAYVMGEIGPGGDPNSYPHLTSFVMNNGGHAVGYWSWKGITSRGFMQWNSGADIYDDLRWPGFVSPFDRVTIEKNRVDTLIGLAYSVDGLTRPAIPVPTRSQLLPIRDVGHISWEPGTGEQTADIERSTNGTSFSALQANYETFKSSHYDLFADSTATVGSTYYYRIKAKNTSGSASYSNVVGPVVVANRWLVDDMWDATKLSSYTAGCLFEQSYTLTPYHSDLAVCRSTGGNQNIVYNLAGNVNQVTVVASNDTTTITFEGSVTGSSYAVIATKRLLYPPLHAEYVGHPRVLYETANLTASGYRYVRINFGANDALNRVEIAHSGTSAPAPTEYVVDNTSPSGFNAYPAGSWTSGAAASSHYGHTVFLNSDYLHDGDIASGGGKNAVWTSPIQTTDTYDVFMRWSGSKADNNRPQAAPVEVNYNGGVASLSVDQRYNPGQWNRIGTWSFTGGSGDYVKITDASAGFTIADSVRWVKILGYDNFADQNDTGWIKTGGTWSVVNDGGYAYDQASTTTEALATFGNTAWRDYVYEADIKVTAEGAGATGPALVFRAGDTSNYYMLQLRRPAGVARLWKKQAGTFTQIGSDVPFASSIGAWYALRVELAGTSIRCYVNEAKVFDVLDSTFSGGAVGFRTGSTAARLDNVHIK